MAVDDQPAASDVTPIASRLDFTDEVLLVTGGGSGIGRAVGFALGAAEADVVFVDRDSEALDHTGAEFGETFDGDVTTVRADVSDETDVERCIRTAIDAHGRLDGLVNVAGVAVPTGTEGASTSEWRRLLDINLTSVYLCSTEAVPHLEPGGRIVNIASIAGVYGSSLMSHYAAAKAGIINFTRSAAAEWAPRAVRVNAVAPGAILTPAIEALVSVDAVDHLDRSTVDRSIGLPAEVADTVCFLLSPASSYINGAAVVVGGVPPTQETVLDI